MKNVPALKSAANALGGNAKIAPCEDDSDFTIQLERGARQISARDDRTLIKNVKLCM
jgi:hypothetical protein